MRDFLRDVLVGVVSLGIVAIISRFCTRHIFPWFSDYRARRSIAATQRKIARLHGMLDQYDRDFANIQLFIGRIISETIMALFCLIVVVSCLILNSAIEVHLISNCVIYHDCNTINQSNWGATVVFVVAFLFLFFSMLWTIKLEIHPNEYRSRLNERIRRLEKRISENVDI